MLMINLNTTSFTQQTTSQWPSLSLTIANHENQWIGWLHGPMLCTQSLTSHGVCGLPIVMMAKNISTSNHQLFTNHPHTQCFHYWYYWVNSLYHWFKWKFLWWIISQMYLINHWITNYLSPMMFNKLYHPHHHDQSSQLLPKGVSLVVSQIIPG